MTGFPKILIGRQNLSNCKDLQERKENAREIFVFMALKLEIYLPAGSFFS